MKEINSVTVTSAEMLNKSRYLHQFRPSAESEEAYKLTITEQEAKYISGLCNLPKYTLTEFEPVKYIMPNGEEGYVLFFIAVDNKGKNEMHLMQIEEDEFNEFKTGITTYQKNVKCNMQISA